MSGRGILDADMTTVGGWIRDGFRWWIDELAGMVPPAWRRLGSSGRLARFDGTRLSGGAPGVQVAISLAPELCLVRTIDRASMSDRDLAAMLAIDADRIMPMPAETIVVAGRVAARGATSMTARVAALPREKAIALASAIAAAGAIPTRVFLEDGKHSETIEFLPALRAAGLLARRRGMARIWWAAVAFLFVFNVALLVWRDSARVQRLKDVVEAQRPAVSASRMIAARVASGQRVARASLAQRRAHDPLWVLGQVSSALPPGAWVQRFGWDGETLKLAGYRPRNANVLTALRAAPGFSEVRNSSSDTVAEIPAGQPFDVTARISGPAR